MATCLAKVQGVCDELRNFLPAAAQRWAWHLWVLRAIVPAPRVFHYIGYVIITVPQNGNPALECIHPYCPKGFGLHNWAEVAQDPAVALRPFEKSAFVAHMQTHFGTPAAAAPLAPPPISKAALARLLSRAPCLYNQLDEAASARAIVHFCELTLGGDVTSANVVAAFLVQHPSKGPTFSVGPVKRSNNGGDVMEMLCSEVLANSGIPLMSADKSGWPIWTMPGHTLLNEGQFRRWKALGDILVPCAPTNLIISVKSEAARERLLYSGNSIEGIGFGFFSEPDEFWTVRRMTLFKRMGFSAVYMPDDTCDAVLDHVNANGTAHHAININGRPLYRPLSEFGGDMARVVGRSSDEL